METVFALINLLVLPFWFLMILLPRWRWTERIIGSPLVVVPIAVLYVGLILFKLGPFFSGLFDPSLRGISRLLGTPAGATAAWAHLLAFDLFVGRWIYLDSREREIPAWLMAIVLFLALMFGPLGLLLYLTVRTVRFKAVRQVTILSLSLMVLAACGNAASPSEVDSAEATATPVAVRTGQESTTATPAEGEPAGPDLTTELVAHYPFDGSAEDASGNGNHGTVSGATLVEDRFGQADSAYQFDGQDDYIEIPDGDGLDLTFEASISLWLYSEPQPTGDFYTILEKSDPERDGHSRYGMWIIEDKAEFCVEPASNDFQRCLDSEIPLEPQQWHHLVGTYDGATLRIYVDGEPAGERTFPRSGISQNSFELYVGTDLYQSRTVYTTGRIDEIRIYKRMLAPDEIQLLYEAEQ